MFKIIYKNYIKEIIVFCCISMFLVGCSQSEKKEKGFQRIIKENQVQTEQKVKKEKLSEICDWGNAKIMAYEYAPSFGETLILQNQNYIFYPEDGRKIIRISKSDGRKKQYMKVMLIKKHV